MNGAITTETAPGTLPVTGLIGNAKRQSGDSTAKLFDFLSAVFAAAPELESSLTEGSAEDAAMPLGSINYSESNLQEVVSSLVTPAAPTADRKPRIGLPEAKGQLMADGKISVDQQLATPVQVSPPLHQTDEQILLSRDIPVRAARLSDVMPRREAALASNGLPDANRAIGANRVLRNSVAFVATLSGEKTLVAGDSQPFRGAMEAGRFATPAKTSTGEMLQSPVSLAAAPKFPASNAVFQARLETTEGPRRAESPQPSRAAAELPVEFPALAKTNTKQQDETPALTKGIKATVESSEQASKLIVPVTAATTTERQTHHSDQNSEAVRPQTGTSANFAAAPEKSAPQAREFVLQLPSGVAKRVEVHLVECAGRVRITVRSTDPQLTAVLRSNLTELVRTVTGKGMRIDTWTPPETYPMTTSSTSRQLGADADAGTFQQDDSRRNRQDVNPDDQRQKRGTPDEWLAELEDRLGKD